MEAIQNKTVINKKQIPTLKIGKVPIFKRSEYFQN